MVSACPGKSYRRSRMSGSHTLHTPAARRAQARTCRRRSADNGNHPAIAVGPSTPCRFPPSQKRLPTPSGSWGIPLPCLHTTCGGRLSQADTHLISMAEESCRVAGLFSNGAACDYAPKEGLACCQKAPSGCPEPRFEHSARQLNSLPGPSAEVRHPPHGPPPSRRV